MEYQEREAQARAIHEQGQRNVREKPAPEGQKFPVGARVRIADDLGPSMHHFPKGCLATVNHTYAHAFGGDNIRDYALDVDGFGFSAWYHEHQLTLVEDEWPDIVSEE